MAAASDGVSGHLEDILQKVLANRVRKPRDVNLRRGNPGDVRVGPGGPEIRVEEVRVGGCGHEHHLQRGSHGEHLTEEEEEKVRVDGSLVTRRYPRSRSKESGPRAAASGARRWCRTATASGDTTWTRADGEPTTSPQRSQRSAAARSGDDCGDSSRLRHHYVRHPAPARRDLVLQDELRNLRGFAAARLAAGTTTEAPVTARVTSSWIAGGRFNLAVIIAVRPLCQSCTRPCARSKRRTGACSPALARRVTWRAVRDAMP